MGRPGLPAPGKNAGTSPHAGSKSRVADRRDFPDPYNKTLAAVEKLFQRLCTYMQPDRDAIELEICPDETEALRKTLPYWRGNSGGAAGLYTHDAAGEDEATKRMVARSRAWLGRILRTRL